MIKIDTKEDRWEFSKEGMPGFYYVDFERCATAAQLADWLLHMSVKNWWTTGSQEEFLALVKNHG